MDARAMIQAYRDLMREIGDYYELMSVKGIHPPDMWKKLADEAWRFAAVFGEALDLLNRGAEVFTVVKRFDVKSIMWMREEIRAMSARIRLDDSRPNYVLEFIRDIVKSFIFSEAFVTVRTDNAGFMEKMIKANDTVLAHKGLVLGFKLSDLVQGEAEDPFAVQQETPPARSAKPRPSLLAAARAWIGEKLPLPHPSYVGFVSLEECLKVRRTVHGFAAGSMSLEQVSQLLFAAQGITDPRGFRTSPSAKASYPLEFHVIANDVQGLPAGVYTYDPFEHQIVRTKSGDLGDALAASCFNQEWVAKAPLVVAVTAYATMMFGMTLERSIECGLLEAGHATQNLLLQACALDLATSVVGEFNPKETPLIVGLKANQRLVYLICVGPRP